jgi:hypothetical protein
MTEKRWQGWQIPKDVEQEVSYLIGLHGRTEDIDDKFKIDREIVDLIQWSNSGSRSTLGTTFTIKGPSRREAILAQKERRE